MTKKKRPADTFSFTDLAHAAGVSKRDVQHLVDRNLLPDHSEIVRLHRIAVAGGFVSAGMPLLLSAKVANAIIPYFGADVVPTGLAGLAGEVLSEGQLSALDHTDDFWLHRAVFRHPRYAAGKAMPADFVVEIVDREGVFINTHGNLMLERFRPDFIGSIEGWERGNDANVLLLRTTDTDLVDKDAVQKMYSNAVGKTVVNVSLAVRNALDRLADRRLTRKPAKTDHVARYFVPRSRFSPPLPDVSGK